MTFKKNKEPELQEEAVLVTVCTEESESTPSNTNLYNSAADVFVNTMKSAVELMRSAMNIFEQALDGYQKYSNHANND